MSDRLKADSCIQQWQSDGDFFNYRRFGCDYSIFYKDSDLSASDDDKPILLMIHGFPTSSIDWRPLWSQLSQHFRLLTLDMMGFGLSEKPKHYAYSIHDQADIYQALLNKLNITKYHILAHDYGDTVAQELLARQLEYKEQPEIQKNSQGIQSTVLLNGGLFPETHRPVFMQKLLASPIGFLLIKLYSFKKFKKTFSAICSNKMTDNELETYWKLLQYKQGVEVMPKLIRYMQERRAFRQRWVGALENSVMPMRLIDGIEDPISGAHMVTRYKQLIAEADVIELEGVGHYPQVEAPSSVASAALRFWRSHGFIN